MRAAAHFLDDEERAEIEEIGLAASGRSRRADFPVDIKSRAENRRVARATGNLPRQAARRRDAADVALRVDAVAVDRPVVVLRIDPAFGHHVERDLPIGLLAILRREVVQRIGPPLPLEPLLARALSVEI